MTPDTSGQGLSSHIIGLYLNQGSKATRSALQVRSERFVALGVKLKYRPDDFFLNLWWQHCCVTAVQFILFNFANYSPSIAMELKVSKKITGK